ncbi:TspO/MBR family protein [Haloferacaceae archaeon DSL9]
MSTSTSIAGRRSDLDRRDVVGAVFAAVLVNIVGASGVVFTNPDSAWFQSLTLPWFYPPQIAFSVVWTALFTLMGISAYLVYRRGLDRRAVQIALGLFATQMVVNVSWSAAFFGLQNPLFGLGVIAVLWILIVATIRAFARVDRAAAALLVPYLAWVSFAAVLNYGIWRVN